ncbi:MAG TPA: DUF2249 domain-containing protein [Longimicrobiales bacterium]|nr:DUF2249 domain-containing protein [Longimicrobiales bacterium]
MIAGSDRVSAVLAGDETLIDVFIELSPAFERLRNPTMRRIMTRLVTVEQAARMGGVDCSLLLARLNEHAGAPVPEEEAEDMTGGPLTEKTSPAAMPWELAMIPAERTVTLDVRDELRAGREPFSLIMDAVREVPDDGAFVLRAIFEPVPLYAVLAKRGFLHWTEQRAADDWVIHFYSATAAAAAPAATAQAEDAGDMPDDVVVLDVRGLEPPEPMMRTLAALEQLPPGGTLVQLNVRVPQFLIPLLEERGFQHEVREQGPDLVRLFIRRTGDT